jgi:GNAT superfamily N-acetyltransferase
VNAELNAPEKTDFKVRRASQSECAAMARLINSAFVVEKFIEGERTDEAEILARMQNGEFFLGCDESGAVVASVYVELRGRRGYFGMLAVDPKRQGNGLGRKMVEAAEEYCRRKGCTEMDLTVLSLRPELLPLYRKLGYTESGVDEFRPARPLRPGLECHCIVMSKKL